RSYGDWSSDVCSSDLRRLNFGLPHRKPEELPRTGAVFNSWFFYCQLADLVSCKVRAVVALKRRLTVYSRFPNPKGPPSAHNLIRSEERRVGKGRKTTE